MAVAGFPGENQVLRMGGLTGPLTLSYRRNPRYMAKRMDSKLIRFLQSATLGPYWTNVFMTNQRIQKYLSFLDENNPFYGLVNELTIEQIITLYYLYNGLSDNETNGEIRETFGSVGGKNELINLLITKHTTPEDFSGDNRSIDNFAEENEANRVVIVRNIEKFKATIRMGQIKGVPKQ